MRRIIWQPGQTGGNGSWTKLLDIGYLFHSLTLDWSGAAIALADILNIKYLINGTIYMDLSGAEIDAINQRDGMPAFGVSGNTLLIPFDLMNMRDPRMREMTAINTGVAGPTGKIITSHQIIVTLNPAANQNFGIYADVEGKTPDGPGLVRRFATIQNPASTSSAGTNVTQGLTFGTPQYAYWRRVFVTPDSGNILSQGLKTNLGDVWSPQVPVSVANANAVGAGIGGPLVLFGGCLDFGFAGMGYTSMPKVVPADPKNPASTPTVVPDTGNNPYLYTPPLKGGTITVNTVNDTGAINNNFLLEALGEID